MGFKLPLNDYHIGAEHKKGNLKTITAHSAKGKSLLVEKLKKLTNKGEKQ
jgi:hypothetical protein